MSDALTAASGATLRANTRGAPLGALKQQLYAKVLCASVGQAQGQ